MVRGLEKFRNHFAGMEDCYILIGGTACDLWMEHNGLDFRATKDLDVVLVVEALRSEFLQRVWSFVREGSYRSLQQSRNVVRLYRFSHPAEEDYPFLPLDDMVLWDYSFLYEELRQDDGGIAR